MNISHSPIRSLHCLKSCYYHIRALRCIRPYFNLHTAKTIATSIGHSKLDYFNSLYYGHPKYQINRLQHIQNALARTVVQAPQFQHITPLLKSFHWLKVSERNFFYLTYKIFDTTQPPYLYDVVFTAASSGSQDTLFTLCHSDQTTIIAQSHSPLLPTCFTSSLEPASYITQDSSSKYYYSSPSQRPSFEHAGLTC